MGNRSGFRTGNIHNESMSDFEIVRQVISGGRSKRASIRRCKHVWNYHGVVHGRTNDEVAVVRHCCNCGVRQVAFASKWKAAKGDYALDEHYR